MRLVDSVFDSLQFFLNIFKKQNFVFLVLIKFIYEAVKLESVFVCQL